MGKIFKMSPSLSAALGLSAMFGFPFSMLITEDVLHAMALPKEEEEKLRQLILPKMVIAGFATVSCASVMIAGIVAPLIFQ